MGSDIRLSKNIRYEKPHTVTGSVISQAKSKDLRYDIMDIVYGTW